MHGYGNIQLSTNGHSEQCKDLINSVLFLQNHIGNYIQ